MESAAELHIQALIEDELDRIVVKHGYFNSDHEAYAVIKEEIEESREELTKVESMIFTFWRRIRSDDTDNTDVMDYIEKHGIELIKEAVQVVACCQKHRRGHLKEWVEKQVKRVGGEHDAD